jgi:hypothetical protein
VTTVGEGVVTTGATVGASDSVMVGKDEGASVGTTGQNSRRGGARSLFMVSRQVNGWKRMC